jgi:murein DD-endopeptidase MepM/ murein hydrolase activator NlpD
MLAAPAAAQQGNTTTARTKNIKATTTSKSTTSAAKSAKLPLANKNVAIGIDAVPALPRAFLGHGCLDSTHGLWLSEELGAAGDEWSRLGAPFSSIGEEAAPAGAAVRCVHFASVRSPSNRIETLAVLPLGPLGPTAPLGSTAVTPLPVGPSGSVAPVLAILPVAGHGEVAAAAQPVAASAASAALARRIMVVSRLDLGAAPTATWQDLAEPPGGYREVWMPVSGVLGGEVSEQVPARWQRDVTVLVRQMKKHAQASDSDWVRVVLQDEGDAARVSAVEIVDESGQAVDSAIWLERGDAPGGFVSARGGDHERVLWQAPVDYRRISRGVGSANVIVRKRVVAKAKTPGGKPRTVIRTFRSRGQHQGVDFAAPSGTPVVTVAAGTVVHAGKSGGYGNLVVVDHGGGITTYYAHLSAYGAGVQEGSRVERGQEIGLVGSTGMSTGPHLHYEIRKDGRYLDPADPTQALPNWGLVADEHRNVLTRLLALSLSREAGFARATRTPALASAPQTVPAE